MNTIEKNEKIIWKGKPLSLIFLTPYLLLSFLLILLMTGPILFTLILILSLEEIGISSAQLIILNIINIFSLIIEIAFILSPLIYGILKFQKTEYIVTNKKIILKQWNIEDIINTIEKKEISEVLVKYNLLDKMISNCGTIIISKNNLILGKLYHIIDPEDIIKLIK